MILLRRLPRGLRWELGPPRSSPYVVALVRLSGLPGVVARNEPLDALDWAGSVTEPEPTFLRDMNVFPFWHAAPDTATEVYSVLILCFCAPAAVVVLQEFRHLVVAMLYRPPGD